MNIDIITEFSQKAMYWLVSSGPRLLFILILTFVLLRVSKAVSKKMLKLVSARNKDIEFQKRADTLAAVIRYVLTILILLIAVMMVLKEFKMEVGPIIAAAGVLGSAVGFGAQSLVKDIISGFFILLEDQIRVGDVVQIADKGGLVEKVNLKMTILRDLAGNVHYVPNGQITVVTNMTKDYSRYVFEIGVAYREDVDEVIEVIKKVDEELRQDEGFKYDVLEPIEILGLDKFGDSAIVIKARNKTQPIKQWRVAREFNKRLKKAFDQNNIEIPFPHVTLYPGQDKDGAAPPLNLRTEQTNE